MCVVGWVYDLVCMCMCKNAHINEFFLSLAELTTQRREKSPALSHQIFSVQFPEQCPEGQVDAGVWWKHTL